MFHVELRQFPHVARSFNLTREELDAQILVPWVAGASIELQDRQWSSAKARLTILEGPALRPDEIGLGRGWSNAAKGGENVTARLVDDLGRQVQAPPVDELKQEILAACTGEPLPLGRVVELAVQDHPERRPSELLAVAEQAVWELLHQGEVAMLVGGAAVDREQWQPLLLSWSSWTDAWPEPVALEGVEAT
jgi:hypothetical protein